MAERFARKGPPAAGNDACRCQRLNRFSDRLVVVMTVDNPLVDAALLRRLVVIAATGRPLDVEVDVVTGRPGHDDLACRDGDQSLAILIRGRRCIPDGLEVAGEGHQSLCVRSGERCGWIRIAVL